MERRCENCVWWEPNETERDCGLCRRYPPQLSSRADGRYENWKLWGETLYPATLNSDWCGEFKPRDAE